eukprot:2465601-Prymnesium_polylepis.1
MRCNTSARFESLRSAWLTGRWKRDGHDGPASNVSVAEAQRLSDLGRDRFADADREWYELGFRYPVHHAGKMIIASEMAFSHTASRLLWNNVASFLLH